VHSIKGGAGFFDLVKIGELAHQTENVLVLIRSREMVPTPERVGVLLRSADRLHELIQNPGTSNQADISEVMAALARLLTDPRASAMKDSAPAIERTAKGGRNLWTLLVEDDFASRLLLQTFLSRYGECHIEVEHGILSSSGAKIIMTTAVEDMKEVIRCFQELCDAYLMKPIDLAQLLSHMRSYQLVQ
jgi:chemotaxis protein histidine kinase CheA